MACTSLEALCMVVDCEIKRSLQHKSGSGLAGKRTPPGARQTTSTASQVPLLHVGNSSHPSPFARAAHYPSSNTLLNTFIKVEEEYNRRSSSAGAQADASGHTCASEMSDQEHFAALHSDHAEDHNSGMPIYPFLDDGMHTFDYGRKEYSSGAGAEDVAANDSYKRSGSGMQGQVHNHASMQSQGTMFFHDSAPQPGQLPLFQRGYSARNGAAEATSSLAAAEPVKAPPASTQPSRAASKRAAEQQQVKDEDGDTPPRKQPRLTGFAARMSGTSAYRGVSWHTQTGRWKAQIKVAGKDVNLGRHRDEVEAARAYDRAAICARGAKDAKLNFDILDYQLEIPTLTNTPLPELASSLRGVEQRLQAQTSRFHGVRLNKRTSKWEAYIRVAGKHVHLGCYDSEVAAAQAFDQAALVRQAHNLGAMGGKPQLVTNFPPMIYLEFTNQLFQLANPLMNGAAVEFNKTAGQAAFCKLEDKYVQNLLQKCREQGGSLTAYPNIVS